MFIIDELAMYNCPKGMNKVVLYCKPNAKGGNLLGAGTAEKLRIVSFAFATSVRTVADTLCDENPTLFQGIGKMKDVKVTLYEDNSVSPVAQPHHRILYHMRKKVEEELQRLEDLDIIEKVDGPTPWVSPIVVVPKSKKPDEIRICVDMRMPNKAIKRTRHIMPTVNDILMRLNEATVFSKFDLNSGDHQLELDEQSRNITTFSTHVGLRRYKRLNFGVTSAAEIFQNHITEIISDIPGVLNTSDDILIYGKTQEEHNRMLKKVFARLKKKNLTLNRIKCEFNKDTIEFYGFTFGQNGISPDPKMVEAVCKATAPGNAKEVRSFLGLTNYVSRFISNYAQITKPLRDLTRKNAEWSWSTAQEDAFSELKSKLMSSQVMSNYNPKPMQVTAKKGPMLTAMQSGGTHITRNSSHFKKITAAGSSLQPLNLPENLPGDGGMNDDDLCPVPLDDEHFLQSSDVQQPPDQPLPDSLASHQTPRKYPMRVRAKPSYLKDYVLK